MTTSRAGPRMDPKMRFLLLVAIGSGLCVFASHAVQAVPNLGCLATVQGWERLQVSLLFGTVTTLSTITLFSVVVQDMPHLKHVAPAIVTNTVIYFVFLTSVSTVATHLEALINPRPASCTATVEAVATPMDASVGSSQRQGQGSQDGRSVFEPERVDEARGRPASSVPAPAAKAATRPWAWVASATSVFILALSLVAGAALEDYLRHCFEELRDVSPGLSDHQKALIGRLLWLSGIEAATFLVKVLVSKVGLMEPVALSLFVIIQLVIAGFSAYFTLANPHQAPANPPIGD